LFGGRLPCPPTYIPGGFTTTPRADRIAQCRTYLGALLPFMENVWLSDIRLVEHYYPEYFNIGKGYGNLLAYGVFDLNDSGTSKLLGRGRATAGQSGIVPVDVAAITEQVVHSWYNSGDSGLNPAAGRTAPQYPKEGAYSWLKAPRYEDLPYEVGPLARMWVNGDYRNGVSVLDRHWARAYEAIKIGRAMSGWLDQLDPGGPVAVPYGTPSSAAGIGLTEAPRGALGHWLKIERGRLNHYQIITPTCWNASPTDARENPGPIEKALLGTPVRDLDSPVEVVRVVHSFDPCLSCAVHVMRPGSGANLITLAAGGMV
ncbi:MAG: periplasmic [NiFeSe] hydrogenase large subunit, partial [Acidobacteria bacterium]|nr:periplasmic [NiFeSe] hydrogenase large subunit [Acidobacteriota bacterium]